MLSRGGGMHRHNNDSTKMQAPSSFTTSSHVMMNHRPSRIFLKEPGGGLIPVATSSLRQISSSLEDSRRSADGARANDIGLCHAGRLLRSAAGPSSFANANATSFTKGVTAATTGNDATTFQRGSNDAPPSKVRHKTSSSRHDEKGAMTATSSNRASKSIGKSINIYFPVVLMSILSSPAHADVIRWTPDGRSFVVLKPYDLAESVLPAYFPRRAATKYCSFARKLHRYGFKRTTLGATADADHFFSGAGGGHHTGREDVFSHELFRRDAPELCPRIAAVVGGSGSSGSSSSAAAAIAAAKKKNKKKTSAAAKQVRFQTSTTTRPVPSSSMLPSSRSLIDKSEGSVPILKRGEQDAAAAVVADGPVLSLPSLPPFPRQEPSSLPSSLPQDDKQQRELLEGDYGRFRLAASAMFNNNKGAVPRQEQLLDHCHPLLRGQADDAHQTHRRGELLPPPPAEAHLHHSSWLGTRRSHYSAQEEPNNDVDDKGPMMPPPSALPPPPPPPPSTLLLVAQAAEREERAALLLRAAVRDYDPSGKEVRDVLRRALEAALH
uniref:HSF-type DNA-binding domain-containing protein n=1 Tax=Pseudictyota dubia TaxID=2749911 RepID=A0A7R9Z237_9STRA|mmetsp:Transcript_18817/g.34916  ORF Transcript_18817/g.34916 Transcript_18817/m.34916 type:complete len:551 (+) Transcript_18817:224-1876(+)